nr:tuberculostearic acid methyltransferase UfaA1-like [Nerophis lumbriciformis]
MRASVADLADLDRGWLVRSAGGVRWARRLVLSKLVGLAGGQLHLVENDRRQSFGEAGADGLEATLEVLDPRFYAKVAFGGRIGAAEAYMAGYWRAEDLTAVIRLVVRNQATIARLDGGLNWLRRPLQRAWHRLRRNTQTGSRRNIGAHYDLSNEFFELFLDRELMYSCAIFEPPDASLEEASQAKLDRLCDKLDLSSTDHLLEIGTGWGGLALHAARRHGCRVTTTTISAEQFAYASRRVREAGLEDRITVLDHDYRNLEGQYDKLVSVEMIEAVGLDHLEVFFGKCAELLLPDGRMVLQAITIADRFYDEARDSVDFIQQYIFPGSGIPSINAMSSAVARRTDLTVVHLEDIGLHYATTLRRWRERFEERLGAVRELGFSERFERLWRYYLCYCEGGFLERAISDVQIILVKPDDDGLLPLGRLD